MELGRERSQRDRVPYDVWADQDVLYAPPGDTLDYEMICEWLTMVMEEQGVEITGVYFDRWRAKEFFKAADEKGFATLAHREGVGQGYQSMSPRLEAFETALPQKSLKLDNHRCMNMAWRRLPPFQILVAIAKCRRVKSMGRRLTLWCGANGRLPVCPQAGGDG